MIRWLKSLSLEAKLLLALAVGAALSVVGVIAFLASLEPARIEDSRTRSPDGALEAISALYDIGIGVTGGFDSEVFIQEAGSPHVTQLGPLKGFVFGSSDARITQLRWDGPNKLIISAEANASFKDAAPQKVEISYGPNVRTIALELDIKHRVHEKP